MQISEEVMSALFCLKECKIVIITLDNYKLYLTDVINDIFNSKCCDVITYV